MRITYRLSVADYFDAAQARQAGGRKLCPVLLLAIAVPLFLAWMRIGNTREGYVCLLFALLFLGASPLASWFNKLSFKNAYSRAADTAHKEFSVEISEEGIQVVGSASPETWSHFTRYSESTNAFILYRAGSVDAIFPKRAFDASGMNTFRRLVQDKLACL